MGAKAKLIDSEKGQLPALPPIDSNQRYSTDEAAAYLRISRARLYEHISSGHIRTFMDGRRRFVPGSEIVRRSSLLAT
jgi:excisionase family DNA binding protein